MINLSKYNICFYDQDSDLDQEEELLMYYKVFINPITHTLFIPNHKGDELLNIEEIVMSFSDYNKNAHKYYQEYLNSK